MWYSDVVVAVSPTPSSEPSAAVAAAPPPPTSNAPDQGTAAGMKHAALSSGDDLDLFMGVVELASSEVSRDVTSAAAVEPPLPPSRSPSPPVQPAMPTGDDFVLFAAVAAAAASEPSTTAPPQPPPPDQSQHRHSTSFSGAKSVWESSSSSTSTAYPGDGSSAPPTRTAPASSPPAVVAAFSNHAADDDAVDEPVPASVPVAVPPQYDMDIAVLQMPSASLDGRGDNITEMSADRAAEAIAMPAVDPAVAASSPLEQNEVELAAPQASAAVSITVTSAASAAGDHNGASAVAATTSAPQVAVAAEVLSSSRAASDSEGSSIIDVITGNRLVRASTSPGGVPSAAPNVEIEAAVTEDPWVVGSSFDSVPTVMTDGEDVLQQTPCTSELETCTGTMENSRVTVDTSEHQCTEEELLAVVEHPPLVSAGSRSRSTPRLRSSPVEVEAQFSAASDESSAPTWPAGLVDLAASPFSEREVSYNPEVLAAALAAAAAPPPPPLALGPAQSAVETQGSCGDAAVARSSDIREFTPHAKIEPVQPHQPQPPDIEENVHDDTTQELQPMQEQEELQPVVTPSAGLSFSDALERSEGWRRSYSPIKSAGIYFSDQVLSSGSGGGGDGTGAGSIFAPKSRPTPPKQGVGSLFDSSPSSPPSGRR